MHVTNPPSPDALPAILTLDEVARVLRCSKAHASKLTRGKVHGISPLPTIRLGRRVLVRRDALFQWLSASTSGSVLR
jgi:excisionase family DNA binding protein